MSKIFIGFCAFVMLVLTPSVKADPIVITGGSLSVNSSAVPSYTLTGLNFSVSSAFGDSGNSPATGCIPCVSGVPVSTSSFFVGSSLGSGPATVNGTNFGNVFFFGEFNLGGQSVVLPIGTADVSFTVPFNFVGNIRGCDSNVVCTEVFSTVDLVGQGLVTIEFAFSGTLQDGRSIYSFRSLTYNFQSAEVPEPMTVALLAGGLVGLGARLRARRRFRP